MGCLLEANPDFRAVEKLGHELVQLRRRVVSHYTDMLALNNNSVKVGAVGVFAAKVSSR